MVLAEGGPIPVYVGGLDATTSRSVQAFVEARHRERFSIAERDRARVWLVDLDQPGAALLVPAATAEQVVVGVGFAAQAGVEGCGRYVQKPLTAAAVEEALAEAASFAGHGARHAPAPARPVQRASHARDVFTKGRAWEPSADPARRAPRWSDPPPRTGHARAVHAAPRLVDLSDPGTSGPGTGSAAEALGRQLEVEPIEPRDDGDLLQPSILASYRYPPAAHLDGRLRQVIDQHPGRPWTLRGPLLALWGDPDGSVRIDGGEAQLRHLCAAPLAGGWEAAVATPAAGHGERLDLEVLRWNVGVWCSRGRLAEGIDPFAPVRALAWPDITRCVATPSALPILASLVAAPVRPVDLPGRLGVPRSHVFVVVSALEATGLLERPGAWAPQQQEPTAEAAPRSVLRRLIGRLRAA